MVIVAFEVSLSKVGNITYGRLRNAAQRLYFVLMICPHLYHCNIVRRLYGKQRERYTDVVIKVPKSVLDFIFLHQYGADELFCSGLAIAACEPYNGNGELLPVMPRERLQEV